MMTFKTLAILCAFAALLVIAALLREWLVDAGDGYVATPLLTPKPGAARLSRLATGGDVGAD